MATNSGASRARFAERVACSASSAEREPGGERGGLRGAGGLSGLAARGGATEEKRRNAFSFFLFLLKVARRLAAVPQGHQAARHREKTKTQQPAPRSVCPCRAVLLLLTGRLARLDDFVHQLPGADLGVALDTQDVAAQRPQLRCVGRGRGIRAECACVACVWR